MRNFRTFALLPLFLAISTAIVLQPCGALLSRSLLAESEESQSPFQEEEEQSAHSVGICPTREIRRGHVLPRQSRMVEKCVVRQHALSQGYKLLAGFEHSLRNGIGCAQLR